MSAVARLAPVVRVAPAKLNLTLAVLGRRADGYHDLHSVFVPLALADRLSLAAADAAEDTLHVTGLPLGAGPDNLVLRAVAATRRAVGGGWSGGPGPAPAVAARLEKQIPVAAGLGGGSSDAAATLDGALELWGAELDDDARLSVAAGLGSDVPFFAAAGSGGPALVEGRGERVNPLHGLRGAPGILLVTAACTVSTPDVFAAFDAIRGAGDGSVRSSSVHLAAELGTGLSAADLAARAGVMAAANDLLPAVALVLPALVPFRRALTRLIHRPIGLSGSGPTLWAVYPSLAEAVAAADAVAGAVAAGSLAAPGDDPPFVTATTVAASLISLDPTLGPVPHEGAIHDARSYPHVRRSGGGGTAQPGHRGRRVRLLLGQAAPDPASGTLAEGGIEPETERVMANLTAVLEAAGCAWADVIKSTVFLTDMADFAAMNAIYTRFVADPKPARSTVAVAALPKGACVEIEVMARRPA